MKNGNIAIFVPHKGCPNDCVFCNQRRISGTVTPPTAEDVRNILEEAVRINDGKKPQIAFFGGSFTAIDRDYMTELLAAAEEYAEHFDGIRISTRPDFIDDDILSLLKEKGVKAIELGTQSFSNEVLTKNRRGHTAEDTYEACRKIKAHGFELGLQIMTGMYGSTRESDMMTALKAAEIQPQTVRIYPTLVIKDTALFNLFAKGEYIPQTVEEAADMVAEMIPMFEKRDISVIRVGLHSAGLDGSVAAGPFHPAFRELCESKIYFNNAVCAIEGCEGFTGQIFVWEKGISPMVGQKRENILKLEDKYKITCKVAGDKRLKKYEVEVK